MGFSDSPLVQHLLSTSQPAWQPSRFIHIVAYKHWWYSSPGSSVPQPRTCILKAVYYLKFHNVYFKLASSKKWLSKLLKHSYHLSFCHLLNWELIFHSNDVYFDEFFIGIPCHEVKDSDDEWAWSTCMSGDKLPWTLHVMNERNFFRLKFHFGSVATDYRGYSSPQQKQSFILDSGEYINKVQMYRGTLASTINGATHTMIVGLIFFTNRGILPNIWNFFYQFN